MKKQKMSRRWEWLIQQINQNNLTIGVEVGCFHGRTTKNVLRFCPQFTLLAVDKWVNIKPDANGDNGEYINWDAEKGYKVFRQNVKPFSKRVKILRGDSIEMVNRVEDNSLDIVFIDADHRYKSVRADIIAWTPKLKPGGILSGHDINISGVLKAVEELTNTYTDTKVNEVWFCKKEDVKNGI